MDDCGFDAVSRRLDRLERECRVWRRLGGACLFGLVLLVAGAADDRAGVREVKVGRLVIEDDAGRPRIVLDARTGIALAGDNGERMSLALSPSGAPAIRFLDAGASRLSIGLSDAGAPVVNFSDEKQRRRLALGIFPTIGPMISILDEANKPVFRAP